MTDPKTGTSRLNAGALAQDGGCPDSPWRPGEMAGDLPLSVRLTRWSEAAERLRSVRHQVFVIEQGVPVHEEWDGLDESAWHALACSRGQPVGCGRLLPSGKLGRLAVLSSHRGQGVGRRLVELLLQQARALGMSEVMLHAQVQALGFYGRFGFIPEGEPFDEAGILHRRMRLLTPPIRLRTGDPIGDPPRGDSGV